MGFLFKFKIYSLIKGVLGSLGSEPPNSPSKSEGPLKYGELEILRVYRLQGLFRGLGFRGFRGLVRVWVYKFQGFQGFRV